MAEINQRDVPELGAAVVGTHHAPDSEALWADTLGRVATRAGQTLLILAIIMLIGLLLVHLSPLVVPFLVALIVAAALQPLIRLMKPHMPNGLAAAAALLVGGIGVGGAVAYAVIRMLSQAAAVQKAAVQGFQQAVDYLRNGPLPISDQQIIDARHSLIDFFTSSSFGADALAGVHGAVQVFAETLLGLFILFFLLKDGEKMGAFLTRPFTPRLREKARYSGAKGMEVLGGYLRGTAIVGLVDTALIGGALWILNVPLAITLSILVFIGAFVPIVGATASGAIAALVALVTVDLNAAIWVAGVVLAVNQLESNLLAPLVLGRSMHLHSLAVLLALSAGAVLGGITGTFLAVPLTAFAWAVLKAWNHVPQPEEGP
ncbi:MAG: AI-2E family transporter [Pseudomonadota bacterium]|nr:AI-2E family transporter [Pseudomonadota bacterium]